MKISYDQIKKIFALAREAGLDNEVLHELVTAVTGSESIKALTKRQGIRVIDRLNQILGHTTAADRATGKQVWQINKLAEELGWKDNPRRLRGFLESRQGVSHPKYLKLSQASDVIEALKAMKKRMQREVAGSGKTP